MAETNCNRSDIKRDGTQIADGMCMRRSFESGITMIELMVVVAIVAVLATVAIPSVMKYIKKAKTSEVPAVFAEFSIRQGQYYNETGAYHSAGSESEFYPAVPSGPEAPQEWQSSRPQLWKDLRIQLGKDALYCSYVTMGGESGDSSNIGSIASSEFAMVAPNEDWFYIVGQCDFDGSNTLANNSLYFMRSGNDTLQRKNEGR